MNIVKYPKTMHLPWSPNLQNDDRRIESLEFLEGKRVVVSEKMDGENTSMYKDYIHARSPSPLTPHASRNRIKQLHDSIKHEIPDTYRLCGENLYAKHSIHYTSLPGYFLIFGIWDGDMCLSWPETELWAELLGLPTVPILWNGIFNNDTFEREIGALVPVQSEGYVVRIEDSFHLSEFGKVTAKYVRKNHVQTSKHWMTQPVVPNLLNEI